MPGANKDIIIKGARVHNLKNIDVTIPHNKLVVVTGVSGSGKSSLTMDTLFAEGQRRYVESLSSYARQFMKTMNKPAVDNIEGLCPAIAIEQKVISKTPRSTVGSLTEINDYLRLLYAKIGKTFSPISGALVTKHEVRDVVDYIIKLPEQTKVFLIVPFKEGKHLQDSLENYLHNGFTRLYIRNTKATVRIEDVLSGEVKLSKKDEKFILIDRYVIRAFEEDEVHRISDSVLTAFEETNGDAYLDIEQKDLIHFCNRFELDGMQFEEPQVNLFNSNNPFGACPTCEGFGSVLGIDEDLVIPNKSLSLHEGAVACWKGDTMQYYQKAFIKEASSLGFPIHKAIKDLSEEQYALLWEGNSKVEGINDFFTMVQSNLYKMQYRILQARYRGRSRCPECKGERLRKEASYVKVDNTTIGKIFDLPAYKVLKWISEIQLNESDETIAKRIVQEVKNRLETLVRVGLGYLSLARTASTLSGGESQRIQLTRVIGSNLTDSLYILDEPSIGLHTRDTINLIAVLKTLKDLGNTVVIVEHDETIMREADYIIDIGPLASTQGGQVIAAAAYKELIKNKNSLTAQYLNGSLKVERENFKADAKKSLGNHLKLSDCSMHNLKGIDVSFPLNCLTAVTGVSGSGKSTLIKQLLYPALRNALGDFTIKPGLMGSLSGDVKQLTGVEMVDQNPIGKSSRSNPVSYIGCYDLIRELLADQHLAKTRGYRAGYFSYNVDGGRCDTCKGEGETVVAMQFLADVHLECESCKGMRFKEEVLEITYRGKNIHDILTMSVDDALIHFEDQAKIIEKLKSLNSVGLGYISLGQSSDTLSGGEAQRVKLASYLDKSYLKQKILFLFDEPTTGLHFHDINKLLKSFQALIDNGHSVLIIEHNEDVIKNADWIIDLGPEAGEFGGNLVYSGPLGGLAKVKESITGGTLFGKK
jgi:excinuclease ABC subunit A